MYTLKHYLLLIVLLFSFTLSYSQNSPKSLIIGQIEGKPKSITLGKEPVEIEQDGSFSKEYQLEFSNILRFNVNGNDYEIYLQPGKTVQVSISDETITFQGDLINENQHLLADKKINDEVIKYLSKNWYTLHRGAESQFIHKIDSIREVFLTHLKDAQMKGNNKLSEDFSKLNKASIHYSFDRIILRYPEQHRRFTGNQISLSQDAIAKINSPINAPEYLLLESYQKYFRAYLGLKIKEKLANQKNYAIYQGQLQTQTALGYISNLIDDAHLRDFWSFEYIKAHIESYTWINGKQFLDEFKSNCTSPKILSQSKAYEKALLTERKGHDIIVYKSIKGYHLEAHIFKPSNFDKTKTYPVLAAFHGGGWVSGHADWTFGSAQRAANNGMIGIAIEYRLSNRDDITPVEAIEDSRDAIRWIRKQADSLHINPKQVIAKGISAGGHLALCISILKDTTQSSEYDYQPNTLVLVSPAIDAYDGYFKSLLRKDTDPGSLSPLDNLNNGTQMPNTLILQGRTDRLTPTTFAQEFTSKMDSLGYSCNLKIYEGCGHIFTPSHLDDTGFPQPDPEIYKQAMQEEKLFFKRIGVY